MLTNLRVAPSCTLEINGIVSAAGSRLIAQNTGDLGKYLVVDQLNDKERKVAGSFNLRIKYCKIDRIQYFVHRKLLIMPFISSPKVHNTWYYKLQVFCQFDDRKLWNKIWKCTTEAIKCNDTTYNVRQVVKRLPQQPYFSNEVSATIFVSRSNTKNYI